MATHAPRSASPPRAYQRSTRTLPDASWSSPSPSPSAPGAPMAMRMPSPLMETDRPLWSPAAAPPMGAPTGCHPTDSVTTGLSVAPKALLSTHRSPAVASIVVTASSPHAPRTTQGPLGDDAVTTYPLAGTSPGNEACRATSGEPSSARSRRMRR